MPIQTFLYVIGSDQGPVKIGISNNPLGRLATIQTGCHVKVHLWFTKGIATRELALMHERAIHQDHKDRRLNGEWFDMDPGEGAEAIDVQVDTYEAFEERARNGEFA